MLEVTKLTKDDLLALRTESKEAIMLIKQYAPQYRSKEHYEHLGASCVMSATQTVNAIISSTSYLEGKFVIPDEIHVERLVEWFVNNRDYDKAYELKKYIFKKRRFKMSNTKEIMKLAKLKSESTKSKVLEVLDDMVKNNENITFYSVNNKAGVSKSFIYNNSEVREAIEHYRTNSVNQTQSKDAKDVIIDSQKLKIKELEK